MLKFCVIENNIVVDVIIADSKEVAEQVTGNLCLLSDGTGIGDIYDSEHGVIIPSLEENQIIPEETPAAE